MIVLYYVMAVLFSYVISTCGGQQTEDVRYKVRKWYNFLRSVRKPEAGVLKKLSLAGLAKLSRLRYS